MRTIGAQCPTRRSVSSSPPAPGVASRTGSQVVLSLLLTLRLLLADTHAASSPAPTTPAAAQPSAPSILQPPRRWTSRTWQTQHGLPQSTVNALLRTRDGFLWVGTGGGLARFDGVRFRTFGLEDGLESVHIRTLHETVDGRLWVGTAGGGLARWQNGRFHTLDHAEGFPSTAIVICLASEPDNTLWIGTEHGLWRMRANRCEPITEREGLPPKQVRALLRDSHGRLWASLMLDGLYQHSPEGFRRVPNEAGLASTIYSLAESSLGNVWAGAGGGRIWRLQNGQWTRFAQAPNLPNNILQPLAGGSDPELWIGARDDGIALFRNGQFEPVPGAEHLLGVSIAALHAEPDGAIWVGTVGSGLTRLTPELLHNWGAADGLEATNVTTVVEDNSGLWVGTYNHGIWRLDHGRFARLRDPEVSDYFPFIHTSAITDDGAVWFAGEQCLFRLQQGEKTRAFHSPPIRGQAIRALCADGNSVWMGTFYGGLLHCDGREVRTAATNGTFAGPVTAFARQGPEQLWIASSAGLHFWDAGRLRTWSRHEGLPTRSIAALHLDPHGALWIGTAGGGLVWKKDERFIVINSRHGLFEDFISQIVPDNAGHLWLGGNRGIARLDRSELDRFIAGQSQVVRPMPFGRDEGLAHEHCNGGTGQSAIKLRDGRLAFATLGGLVELDPRRLGSLHLESPQSSIEEMSINGQPTSPTETILVPPGPHRIEARFTAPALRGGDWIRFRTRLLPLEQDWIPAGSRRLVSYVALPHGRYTLEVQAANARGRWNPVAASLGIVIQPYFWQTTGFALILAAIATGSAFVWYQKRIATLESRRNAQTILTHQLIAAQEAERARLARELHDDITQRLARLAIDAGVAERAAGEANATATLSQIRKGLVQLSEDVHSLSYQLHPSLLEDLGFAEAMRVECERFERQEGLRCTLRLPNPPIALPRAAALGLYRISQEALRNAARHARASQVEVTLRPMDGGLQLAIRDNGHGFELDLERDRHSLGLAGMRERASLLGGELDIESAPNHGTAIMAWVPLPEVGQLPTDTPPPS